MTDITELAQSLKAAAERVIKNYDSEWFEAGHQICTVHKSKINLISLANPANILALVEALEKAQQRIAELEQKHCGGALMERELAHSQVINKLMSEIDNRDFRIAELESRTVTVKLPEPPGPMSVGARTVYFGIVADVVSAFQYGITAAGIKVEA